METSKQKSPPSLQTTLTRQSGSQPNDSGNPSEVTSQTEIGNTERKLLVKRAGLVGLGTLFSRALGLLRDVTLAALFSRDATDAFFVAFTIPNALRQLVGEGAMSSAVIPVLSEYEPSETAHRAQEKVKDAYAHLRGLSIVVLSILTLLGVLFARPITRLFLSRHEASSSHLSADFQFDRTVQLTRFVFPYIFFMGTAALGTAALHLKKKFTVASFAPALLNIAFLFSSFFFFPLLVEAGYDPALAMCFGAILGGLLQVMAQWPSLYSIGFLGRPKFSLRHPSVLAVVKRMVPMMFGIGVYYIDIVLSRRFLSEFGEGAQSYFSWAMRLCDFPQGIFVMAISAAALPSISSLAARGNYTEVSKTYLYGLKLSLLVSLPISVFFVALSKPVTIALFQRGQFGAHDAHETARALVWQGAAMFTVSVVRQTVPVFYALKDTKTPVFISCIDLLVFIFLALTLGPKMKHVGISVAVAGSSLVQMFLLVCLLKLKFKVEGFFSPKVFWFTFKVGLASLGAALIAASVSEWSETWSTFSVFHLSFSLKTWGQYMPALIGLFSYIPIFLLATWALKIDELSVLKKAVKRRFGFNEF